jgi:uncharacterized protein YegP (UPF0339 family)
MSAFYVIKRNQEGKFFFELRASGEKLLMFSGERTTVALCRSSITSLRMICDSHLEDTEGYLGEKTETLGFPKFRIDKRGRGVYILSLYAKNGKKVAVSRDCSTLDSVREILDSTRRRARSAITQEKIESV